MWQRQKVGARLSTPYVKGNLWPHWQIVFKPTHNTLWHTGRQYSDQHTTYTGTLADSICLTKTQTQASPSRHQKGRFEGTCLTILTHQGHIKQVNLIQARHARGREDPCQQKVLETDRNGSTARPEQFLIVLFSKFGLVQYCDEVYLVWCSLVRLGNLTRDQRCSPTAEFNADLEPNLHTGCLP